MLHVRLAFRLPCILFQIECWSNYPYFHEFLIVLAGQVGDVTCVGMSLTLANINTECLEEGQPREPASPEKVNPALRAPRSGGEQETLGSSSSPAGMEDRSLILAPLLPEASKGTHYIFCYQFTLIQPYKGLFPVFTLSTCLQQVSPILANVIVFTLSVLRSCTSTDC